MAKHTAMTLLYFSVWVMLAWMLLEASKKTLPRKLPYLHPKIITPFITPFPRKSPI
jgi:hypothetical protein